MESLSIEDLPELEEGKDSEDEEFQQEMEDWADSVRSEFSNIKRMQMLIVLVKPTVKILRGCMNSF